MNIKKILKPVLSIVLALVLGAAVIAMVGENPLSVYRSMLLGAFGSKMSIQKDSCWKPARIIWSLQMKNRKIRICCGTGFRQGCCISFPKA